MTTSMQMDLFGHITFIKDTADIKKPFFRKYYLNNNEKEIVKILFNQNQKHLLRIFRVEEEYYDAELLDLFYADISDLSDNIKSNLDAFHDLNIIYIDLKDDNIGYSHIDKCWKLFDFDCSGICTSDKHTWTNSPSTCYNLENLKMQDMDNLLMLDEIIYQFYTSTSLIDLDMS